MIQWLVKALLNWIVGPLTDLFDKWIEYKRDKVVVQAGVLTGTIKATAKTAPAIAKVQVNEMKDPWFRATKLAAMWIGIIFVGAHVLRAVYFHHWVILEMPPSIYVIITMVFGYLFIAGPLSISELISRWMFGRKR